MNPRRPTRSLALLLAATGALLLAGCGKGQHAPVGKGVPAATTTSQTPSGATIATVTGNTTRLAGEGAVQDAAAVAETVYPGLTAETRPAAVVLVESGDWPDALAAASLAGAPLHAPLLYGSSEGVPAATATALATIKPHGARALGGAQVIAIGGVEAPSGYAVDRIAGASPYAIAAKLAALLAKLDGGRVANAVVANASGQPALAMPAAGLAAESGAPLLLVQAGRVPRATTVELEALNRPSIYAIGPTSSIAESTLQALTQIGETRRVGGTGAIANAISVAAYTNGSFGWGVQEPGHGLVFARASSPLVAPAAALLSSSSDYGPLLLLPGREPVPLAVRRYLRDIQPGYTNAPESLPVRGVYNRGWLIGDAEAISLKAQAELDALLRSVPRRSDYPAPTVSP